MSRKSLREIHTWICELSLNSSTLKKVELLKKYLEDKDFRIVCWCAYTSTLSFHIKAFPKFSPTGFADRGWDVVVPILKQLSESTGADFQIKQKLFQAASIDRETYEVVKLICNKDLGCGVAARLINKARPNTIKIMSYMRCATSKHIDCINYEASAQCKADGAFANLFITKDLKLNFKTRNGLEISFLNHIKKRILEGTPVLKFGGKRGIKKNYTDNVSGMVYHGELRVFNEDGSIMNRKAGNGLINQCLKGTIDQKIVGRIFYTVWDAVPIDDFYNGECELTYRNRMYTASTFVHAVNDSSILRMIDHEYVQNKDEAYAFFRKMRASGNEGAIIKNLDGIWEDTESGSRDCIKIKHSFECDLKVVGWKPGKEGSKFEFTVGAILCESSCGKLKVSISGLLDEERERDWDALIDSIVTAEAESIIESKNKTTYSLYTPSFIECRPDRSKADSLERIQEICDESKKTRRRKA